MVQHFEAQGRNHVVDPPRKPRRAPVKYRARITAVSGSFPQWNYTGQRVIGFDSSLSGVNQYLTDGIDLALINLAEFAGTPPYTYGNGVLITSSSGQINSTAAVIRPAVGVGACVTVGVNRDRVNDACIRSFHVPNTVNPCELVPTCYTGNFTCGSMLSSYNVSMPLVANMGSCGNGTETSCSPSNPFATVSLGSTCFWSSDSLTAYCVDGKETTGSGVRLYVVTIAGGCKAFRVDITIYGFPGAQFSWIKRISGPADTPVGIYDFLSASENGNPLVPCSGASTDATIVVAP
jgi:hypothetical protein